MENSIPIIENISKDKENVIPIVFFVSEDNIKYLGVTLESIISNGKGTCFLDVIIFTINVTSSTKALFQKEFQKQKLNLFLRLISVDLTIAELQRITKTDCDIQSHEYTQIFSIKALKEYSRFLFIDSNLIFNADIVNYFNCQENNFALRGFLNNSKQFISTSVMLYQPNHITQNERYSIYENALRNKNLHFNELLSLVFNKSLLSFTSEYLFQVNDAGTICKNKLDDIQVIQWLNPLESWKTKENKLAIYWWKYARKMSYYEELLHNYVTQDIKNINIPKPASETISIEVPDPNYTVDQIYSHDFEKLNHHSKCVILKLSFKIIKVSFVNKYPRLSKLLLPFYKALKLPVRLVTGRAFRVMQ